MTLLCVRMYMFAHMYIDCHPTSQTINKKCKSNKIHIASFVHYLKKVVSAVKVYLYLEYNKISYESRSLISSARRPFCSRVFGPTI